MNTVPSAWSRAQALHREPDAPRHEPLAQLLENAVPTPGLAPTPEWHVRTYPRPERDQSRRSEDYCAFAEALASEPDPWLQVRLAHALHENDPHEHYARVANRALRHIPEPDAPAPVQVRAERGWAYVQCARLARIHDDRAAWQQIRTGLEDAWCRALATNDEVACRIVEGTLRANTRIAPEWTEGTHTPTSVGRRCRERADQANALRAVDWLDRARWWLDRDRPDEATRACIDAARARVAYARKSAAPSWVRGRQIGIALARVYRLDPDRRRNLHEELRQWTKERLALVTRCGLTGEEAGTGIPHWPDAMQAIAKTQMELPNLGTEADARAEPQQGWTVGWTVTTIEEFPLARTREEHGPSPQDAWDVFVAGRALAPDTATKERLAAGLEAGYEGRWAESATALVPALREVLDTNRERLDPVWRAELERILEDRQAPDFARSAHPHEPVRRVRIWLWWLALRIGWRTGEGHWCEPDASLWPRVDARTLHRNAERERVEDPNDWEPQGRLVYASARAGA